MQRFPLRFIPILYMVIFLGLVAINDIHAGEKSVSCSNSFLASLTGALLGDEVGCFLILDPQSDPRKAIALTGEQLDGLERSSLFFYHPFQSWLAKALDQFERQHPKKVAMRGKMNLIVPADYLSAAREMQKSLAQLYPEYATYMQEQYGQLYETVESIETQLLAKSRKSKLMSLPCIAGRHQSHYLKWLGLKVVATYDEMKELDAAYLKKIKKKAAAMDIWLVVGDCQNSQAETIEKIAKAISGQAVVLGGFPVIGRDGENYSWEDLIKNNTRTLMQAAEWH